MNVRRSDHEGHRPGLARARFLFGLCCLLAACSFDDRVEHCASDEQCGSEQECYRGYCIPSDGSEAPDDGGASARRPSTSRNGSGSGGKVGSTSSASSAAGAKGTAAGSGGATSSSTSGDKASAAGSGAAASGQSAGAAGPAAASGSTPAAPAQPGQMSSSGCTPAPEQCNGMDDDCNGKADDAITVECFPDGQTGCIKQSDGRWDCQGICARGTQSCVQGKLGECTGYKAPAMEICTPAGMRAADENCNGMTDESCACAPGEIRSCYGGTDGTLNVGKCVAGTQTCTDGALSACMNAVMPGTETCANQGADDDCNGKADDIQNLGAACLIAGAAGPCRSGKYQCEAGKAALSCIPAATPGQETCNGMDDDCNGKVDDTFNLMTDAKNCGACGKSCGADEACCNGSCINTKKDANNCGACGMTCGSGSTCNGGKCKEPETPPPPPPPVDAGTPGGCQPACGAGQTCCNGSCVDTRSDLKHCGACGNACTGTQPGCCNGKCADLVSNANCGQCGRDCSLLTNGGLTCTCTKASDGSIACTGPVLNVCL